MAADAAALKALLSSSPEFEAFARSPGVAADVKIDVVQHMAATFKLSPVTRNFLCTVAENKRMPELAKMLSAFEVLCRAARGEVKVSVTSARVGRSPSASFPPSSSRRRRRLRFREAFLG